MKISNRINRVLSHTPIILCLIGSAAFGQVDLREDTAGQEVWLPPLVDATDGVTPETGLMISNTDIDLLKPGATTVTDKNSGGATDVSGGLYYAIFDATDTDTPGSMRVSVNESGARPVTFEVNVLPTAIYDAKYAGGSMAANVTAINSDTTAAAQLAETFDNDGTGGDVDASSLSVTGTSTFTGRVDLDNGLDVTCTTANQAGIRVTGNGTGHGVEVLSGTGANAVGLLAASLASSGGSGFTSIAVNGAGMSVSGTSSGMTVQSTSTGAGLQVNSSSGRGVYISAGGTNNEGLFIAGSTGGAGDAVELLAGGTGVGLNASSLAVTGTSTCTGNVALQSGLTITQSSTNQPGVSISGNGNGSGMSINSGSGSTGIGLSINALASNAGVGLQVLGSGTLDGDAVQLLGGGAGEGLAVNGGETGGGVEIFGGETSGRGVFVSTNDGNGVQITSGDGDALRIAATGTNQNGIEITTTEGEGIRVAPSGPSKHGLWVSGGNSGTSDGIKVDAGVGGVGIRGNITGDLIGSIGSVSNPASIWNALTSGMTTADSIGNRIADNLDAAIGDLPPLSYFEALFDDAPTFAEAMDDHGYTSVRAEKIDRLAPALLLSTTIDGAPSSQTSFVLAAGPPNDNALNGALVVVTNDANPASVKKAVGLVKDYAGDSRTVTLVADPGIFTMASGDKVDVIAGGAAIPLWLSGP